MAFLGVISLAGIVINNAIVLIDRIQLEQDELWQASLSSHFGCCTTTFPTYITNHFYHHSRHDTLIPGRWPDVGTYGYSHYDRFAVCNYYHLALCTCDVQTVV